jgi:HAD superfamily hydrolase (TIGR01509 family)
MKTILVDAVDTFIIEGEGIFKEMHVLLETYPSRKIILTNADYEATNKFDLNGMPYEVFTLKHEPEKTDPRYYKTMLAHFGLNAGNVLYLEHSLEAVKSARSIGILTYHYDSERKDLKALKQFIDANL